jgi:LysR family glycine cleavage system transcriptional activator
MRRAAEELHVTHGAVSQQIRALEEFLGRPVFHRVARKLVLTPEGERLHEVTESVFNRLMGVVGSIQDGPRRKVLNVTVGPYMGARWLSPRLHRFWRAHPDIEVRFQHLYDETTFRATDIDVGVVWGVGRWPGLYSQPLFKAESVPVCSASLLRRLRRRAGSELIRNATLLHYNNHREWSQWLIAVGLPVELAERGPVFRDMNVAIEAAIAGQGVAMGTRPMMDEDLRSKRLVMAHPRIVAIDETYQFVSLPDTKDDYCIKAFRSWLLQEAAAGPAHDLRRGSRPS